MRAMSALALPVLSSVVLAMPAHAGDILNNPDPTTVFLLQHKFAKTAPPFEAMAQAGNAVRSSDEFHRPEAIRQADASLRVKAASLEGVKEITVRLNSRFSEYDSQYGEYDFELNDGTYIPYNAFDRQVRIALTNGTRAQSWKLPPKEAEDALRRNKGDRLAALALTLSLMDSPPATDGEPATLNAKIVRYDVLTGYGNVKIGSVSVEPTP